MLDRSFKPAQDLGACEVLRFHTRGAWHAIVKVCVGPKRKEFTIHKNLICDKYDFFRRAFCSGFEEAEKGEMHLPEDDANVFANLTDYLYRGTVPDLVPPSPNSVDPTLKKTCALRRLYYLAEKLVMPALMDQIIDAIMDHQRKAKTYYTKALTIENLYNQTHSNSKLRQYAVAQLVCHSISQNRDDAWM
ncbi:hypothetical protein B0J14DRAFT_702110 [Halenospora varia]|nr:hypothetical protein B0J14DRAFT_702110 [Halenospora varia]